MPAPSALLTPLLAMLPTATVPALIETAPTNLFVLLIVTVPAPVLVNDASGDGGGALQRVVAVDVVE